jgi:hypothetical protein
MLGGTLDEAQIVMRTIASDEGSATHPPKDARLAAITNGWKQAQELFQKGTATRPEHPTKTGIPASARPVRPAAQTMSSYTGNVSNFAARYSIVWNPDGTVSGTYYYPTLKGGTIYRLIGNNHTEGQLYIEEYTGSSITARINLTKQKSGNEIIWSGSMHNTDGKILPMRMVRQR